MREVFICDAVRTPIGRYGGALAKVRTDDLAAVPIRALVARNPQADWSRLDEVIFGCANQAGEDNRNVARMALLLAGLPDSVPGLTVNRLCASGLNAVGDAARAIRAGEMDFAIAGGVESMTRAPFVMGKANEAFAARGRDLRHHDRLALHQSAASRRNTASIPCPRPPRTWREEFQVARAGPGRLRAALAAARRQGGGRRLFRRGDRRGRGAGRQGRPDRRSTRTSIRAPTRRRKISPSSSRSFRQGRHHHRRQRLGRQ